MWELNPLDLFGKTTSVIYSKICRRKRLGVLTFTSFTEDGTCFLNPVERAVAID